MQEEINERKKKKRKSTEPNAAEFESKVPKTTEEFEYENVDFNQERELENFNLKNIYILY